MGGLRHQVDGPGAFGAVAGGEQDVSVAGQGGRVAGDVDDARRREIGEGADGGQVAGARRVEDGEVEVLGGGGQGDVSAGAGGVLVLPSAFAVPSVARTGRALRQYAAKPAAGVQLEDPGAVAGTGVWSTISSRAATAALPGRIDRRAARPGSTVAAPIRLPRRMPAPGWRQPRRRRGHRGRGWRREPWPPVPAQSISLVPVRPGASSSQRREGGRGRPSCGQA